MVRAFLEQSSRDVRFRETWREIFDHIIARVTDIVMSRVTEVDHPDPERGVRLGLEIVFSALAHQIQMHRIDDPEIDEFLETLNVMMLRYMGISET